MSVWRKENVKPPIKCADCGRLYSEDSGSVEVVTDGDTVLCVICAVHRGVLNNAPRR